MVLIENSFATTFINLAMKICLIVEKFEFSQIRLKS